MEQESQYRSWGVITPEFLTYYLKNNNDLPVYGNPITYPGYRSWFVRLVDQNKKTIMESETDVKPINLTHLVNTDIPDMNGPDNRPVLETYVKNKLYDSIVNIIDIWNIHLHVGVELASIFIDSVDTPTQENGLCGELSINVMYNKNKTREENIQIYQIILDKINKLLDLVSKVEIHLNMPTTLDGIVLRYRRSTVIYRNDYMPIPVYCYFKDMDGTLASMLPGNYRLLDDQPYRIYNADTGTFDYFVLDVLNFINYYTHGKLLFNPKEM